MLNWIWQEINYFLSLLRGVIIFKLFFIIALVLLFIIWKLAARTVKKV